jgi:gluconolactonase
MKKIELTFSVLADGFKFPEGPVALNDGSVALVDIVTGLVWRVHPNGKKEVVADVGGGPNGAAVGPDGKLYVCQNGGFDWGPRSRLGLEPPGYTGGSIQRVDLASGAIETLYTHGGEVPIRSPNDIVFDRHGGFWFSDYGKERERDMDVTGVFYAKADGSHCQEVIFPLNRANGVGLSPDGTTLYVTETYTARLWAFDLEGPGRLKRPDQLPEHGPHVHFGHHGRLIAAPGGLRIFDSLAVDAAGNVCIGTLIDGGITVVSPGGEIAHAPLPDHAVTNICFGGEDMTTAYITMSGTGRLVAARWPTKGLPLPHQLSH